MSADARPPRQLASTTAGYTQIVFAIALGALVLHERPAPLTLAGAAIILTSALVLALGGRRGAA
jgi:drug/metabolite transporter (DMT)-like permease